MQIHNKTPYILGLDVGTNSIGWAVVNCEHETDQGASGYLPVSLRALNSRIFEGMLDAKTQAPKNQKRREARGARNRRVYYKKRREKLVSLLTDAGLLPGDYQRDPKRALNNVDRSYAERKLGKPWSKSWRITEKAYCSPYAMRNFSLEEKLKPREFGRLLLHLQRRRGYFSNRGAKYIELINSLDLPSPEEKEEEKKKEARPVLEAIDELGQKLGDLTLGQFIWKESQAKEVPPHRITLFQFEKSRNRRGETVIERPQFRAEREMYEKEFNAIWEKQNAFHGLSEEEAQDIRNAIFNQRPLQSQKGAVGNCSIYPGKKRAAKVRLEYQEFRTLQIINNLRISGKQLSEEQCQQLMALTDNPEMLNKYGGRIAWKEVAEKLGVKVKELNYNEVNYSEDDDGGKGGLIGNRTAQAISDSIDIGAWRRLGKDKQIELVEDLHTIHNKKALYNRLVNHWEFSPYCRDSDPEKGALGLAMNERLEDGYGKYSLKAINKLLPYLRDGLDYYAAVEKIGARESITKSLKVTEEDYQLEVEDVPNIANPIVQKALYEIRRVVNSVVKRYGKPAIIRMEMAREMKSSKRHRGEIASQQKENRKMNEEAEKEILEHYEAASIGIRLEEVGKSGLQRISDKDRSKYKMWKEQGEQCPYCPRPFGIGQLFSGEAEIDHILPYTGFRQNYMNTLVSHRSCNQEKKKRTPYEAWGHDQARWQRIEKFAKEKYGKPPNRRKQDNILKKAHNPESESDFVERQLNDTRYIATASKKMLERYGVPIDVNNGAATSQLRRRWGLNTVLPREPDSGRYKKIDTETGEMLLYNASRAEKSEKSRHDHRHHAVDAFVVAMTDHAMLKSMIEVHKQEQDQQHLPRQTTKEDWIKRSRLRLPESWKGSSDLSGLLSKWLNATVVSHMAKRKVWGALHEETRYGKSHFPQCLYIESMKPGILKKVRQIAEAEPRGDDAGWIFDQDLRSVLLKWAVATQKLKPADRALPRWKGKELRNIVYQSPCMTCRKELTGKFLCKLSKDWVPGKGTWVADQSMHDVLFRWLENNDLNDLIGEEKGKANKIAEVLKEIPPRADKKGTCSIPIRRVRMANPMTGAYIKIGNAYVQPGSNHHFVLFHNGKDGEKERKFQMVTMLEAAKRTSTGKPLIVKATPRDWSPPKSGEWQYELDLCVNDMVYCEDMRIFEDEKFEFALEHRETPYFRVQTMSGEGDKKIDLRLRHHSVSGTESKWGLWRICSPRNMSFRKVQLGNLGLLPAA